MKNERTKIAAAVLLVPIAVTAVVISYTGLHTERIIGLVQAPGYVKEAALVWAEDMFKESNAMLQQIKEEAYGNEVDPITQERVQASDWRISGLTPVGIISPVCGREIEIWAMETQEYHEYARGWLFSHWSLSMDGSGWMTNENIHYLIFDSETKEELRRYRNMSEEAAQDSGELFERIAESMRFYEQTSNDQTDDAREIAGWRLRQIFYKLTGESDSPYHYVDRICYKVEPVTEGTGKYGREEIWKVIINETGEELGRVIYYPEYGDIAVISDEG